MSTIPVPEVLNQIACEPARKGLSIAGIRRRSGVVPDLGNCPSKPKMSRLVWFSTMMFWSGSGLKAKRRRFRGTGCAFWDSLKLDLPTRRRAVKARQRRSGGTARLCREADVGTRQKGSPLEFSPGAGLYFSLLLRPPNPLNCWPLLTHVASVALAQVLKELSAEEWIPHRLAVDLKWPNDVLLSGKKTAGILLETVQQEQHAAAAVLGVGINIKSESLPEELKEIATSVSAGGGSFHPTTTSSGPVSVSFPDRL